MARTDRNTNARNQARRQAIQDTRSTLARANAGALSENLARIATGTHDTDTTLRIVCPDCDTTLDINRAGAIKFGGAKCPTCGRWLHVRLFPNLENYVRGLGTTPSGNDTLDINDDTAALLRGMGLEDLYAVASQELESLGRESMSKSFLKGYGVDTPWDADTIHAYLTNRYADRNPGMQRMNLGNLLRAARTRIA